jgi:hypothetical protein
MKKKETKTSPSSIEFDAKQYETLVRALQVAGSVYGLMSDFVGADYKKQAEMMDELESWILGKAGEFGMAGEVEIFEGKNVLKDEATDKYTDDLIEYEEWAFWDVFAHKMADRDMAEMERKEQEQQAEKVKAEKEGEPHKLSEHELLHLHLELEEKYATEFEEHGLDHVEIREK